MRRSVVTIIALCVFAGVTACGGSATVTEDSSTTTSVTAANSDSQSSPRVVVAPEGYDIIETTAGRTRSYRVVNLADAFPAPLLFVLHGFGGTAEAMRNYAGFEQAIASSLPGGAIVVYPNGSGAEEGLPQSWNAGDCCPFAIYDLVDDVAFFDELITKLVGEFDVDERHVWSVGHSNGGMMSYRLGCELSGRITAIGVAAGALTVSSCTPDSAVSALHIHGDLDAVVPINGGEFAGITFPSAQMSFEKYASAVNCSVNGSIATCPEGTSVSLVTNSAWTHDWQPEWTGLIVDFLAERRAR